MLPPGIFKQKNGMYCAKFWYNGSSPFVCIDEAAILGLHIHVYIFAEENPKTEIRFERDTEESLAFQKAERIKKGRVYINKLRITKQEIHYLNHYEQTGKRA